jgi:integrase
VPRIRNVRLIRGTYYARVHVPEDVRDSFGGKVQLQETLQTGDIREAYILGAPVIARFKREITAARQRTIGQVQTMPARIALADWATKEGLKLPPTDGETHHDWPVIQRIEALQRAFDHSEGYREIDGYDETLAAILTAHGCPAKVGDPIVALMRQEAAMTFLYAAQTAEKGRLANAFMKRAEAVLRAPVETMAVVATKPVSELPAPSLTISKLYERWLTVRRPSEKEKGRLDHQLRRLVEFIGDKPANFVSKAEAAEFMAWAARFPGRKRSAALNALPIRKLVEQFEATNAALAAKDQPAIPTLTKTTVEEWFASYKRMFAYGVDLDLIDKNPFDRLKALVVTGSDSIQRRAFTDEEITTIFTAPLFAGFDRGSSRFRELSGAKLVKDARYWLPILSLFHGGRLAEFAAMPLADLKQTGKGTWYFDLTEREVKTQTSKRQIPLHPHMEKIGFLGHVADLRTKGETWLFPDLDHRSRHGPGHDFSKWWGLWMDKHGLSDPAITHHSWRHTWKRRARASSVKEEMHDVISGHKGLASVSRTYGEGADIEDLARDMALIEFPAFPQLP